MLKYRYTVALVAALTIAVLPAATSAQRARAETTTRGWIGIRPWFHRIDINGKRTERMMVADVIDDSPADRAGIKPGDRIVRINGKEANEGALDELSRGLTTGDTVRLRIAARDREPERDVTLVAVEQPRNIIALNRVRAAWAPRDSVIMKARVFMDSALRVLRDTTFVFRFDRNGPHGFVIPGDSFSLRIFRGPEGIFTEPAEPVFRLRMTDEFEFPSIEFFGSRSVSGAEFTELNDGLSAYFGTADGLLVLKVSPGTPAARAGLEPGDVIVRVNGRDVHTVMELRSEVLKARGESVRLEILRKGQKRTLDM